MARKEVKEDKGESVWRSCSGMEEGYARDGGGGYLGPVWSQWGHFGLEG